MNCPDARELLLEADAAELSCMVASEVSEHLEACDSCRALAARILQAQSTLAKELAGVQPRTPVDAALQSATVKAAAVRRKHSWWAAVPVAAAAGVAGLLLFGRGGPDLPGESWQGQPIVAVSGIDVEAPFGKDVVVFDIKDRPDVVVVWFFDKGDE
jgi:anti-sigma factor RsiW